MTLFIANPSKQHVLFNYRDPRTKLLAFEEIGSGRQIEIGHAWSQDETATVIDFIRKFGGRDAAESHGALGVRFLGLLYREDYAVSREEIELGHAAVVETQERRSVTEAVRAGLGFDRANRTEAKRRGRPPAKVTAVEVEEETERHVQPTGNEVRFSMSVDPEGSDDVSLPV